MQRCDELAASRARLTAQLRDLGLAVAPSEANFLWLPLGDQAAPFAGRAREAGILVWLVDGEGVRITIGSDEANARLLEFARQAAAVTG
jgi:histidinol-phosphate aminotransferase